MTARKRKKLTWTIVFPIVILCILGIAVAGVNFNNSIEKELYDERSYHLQETMSVVSEKAEIIIEDNWNALESAEVILNDTDILENNTISEVLDYIDKVHPENDYTFFLVDNNRNCFRNDVSGGQNKWTDTSLLLSDERRQIAMEEDTNTAVSTGVYVTFLLKLDNPIAYNGNTITHVGLIEPMDGFRDTFLSGAYNNTNETILAREDGTRVYFDDMYSSFNGYNVLNVLKKAEFEYDVTIEKVLTDFENGDEGTALITLEGNEYFIGYKSISNKWRYIIIVPEANVSSNSQEFTRTLTNGFLTFGGLIMVLAILAIATFLYALNRNKKIEYEQELNTRLSIANKHAREAEKEANEANNAKSEFLSNMSHDIRTPINGIIGMLDIADLHKDEPEKLPEYLTRIRGVTNHLLTLINDVLDMSKAESGKIELSNEPFDLDKLIQECSDITNGRVIQRDLKYTVNLDGVTNRYLYGSPLHIRQILLNILGNAVKYTNDGGFIDLTVKQTSSSIDDVVMTKIIVKDSGIGMSKEFMEHIFEPFTRADNSVHSEIRGTGLGMAITKKLVDLMNGNIEVESELGNGSTFVVTLPLQIDQEELSKDANNNNNNNGENNIVGMKVLLVEDNDLNREIAKTLLENKKVIITEAINGKQALDIFTNNKEGTFDLILMDVMMPEMNGLEATKAIRCLDRKDGKDIPIIAMTANAFAEDVAKTKEAGMNEHLSKPLNIQKLIETIAKYKKDN